MSKSKGILNWILLLGWMFLIFYMSNQPADISNNQSDFVIEFLNFLGIELNDYFGDLASLIVRKGAHFTEYLILFFLSYNVSKTYFIKRNGLYSIIFVFIMPFWWVPIFYTREMKFKMLWLIQQGILSYIFKQIIY